MSEHKTKREVIESVKTKLSTVNGQTIVIKVYPEAGKRASQKVRCKG